MDSLKNFKDSFFFVLTLDHVVHKTLCEIPKGTFMDKDDMYNLE